MATGGKQTHCFAQRNIHHRFSFLSPQPYCLFQSYVVAIIVAQLLYEPQSFFITLSFTAILERSSVTISGASGPGTPALVFLHGLGADQASWRLLVPHFAADC